MAKIVGGKLILELDAGDGKWLLEHFKSAIRTFKIEEKAGMYDDIDGDGIFALSFIVDVLEKLGGLGDPDSSVRATNEILEEMASFRVMLKSINPHLAQHNPELN